MDDRGRPSQPVEFEFHEDGGDNANFRTENDPNQADEQRQDVIARKGRVAVSCFCKDIVHGYLSTESDDLCTIIVLYFRFESRENGHRIKKVEVDVKFSPREQGASDPVVDAIYPDGFFVVQPVVQHETVTAEIGGKLGGQIFGVEVGAELKRATAMERESLDCMKVQGSKEKEDRNYGLPNSVSWILRENGRDQSGVPTSMQAAIRLKRKDLSRFQATFTMKVTPTWLTSALSVLKSNPRDDPVHFNPSPQVDSIQTTSYKYDDDSLGESVLEHLSQVTVTTVWQGNA